MEISKRQKEILKHIIEHYVETSEPISSNLIYKLHFPDLSSQTIRNEMAYLEKINLIEKLHTSSGRVPSVKGYNYYNENILTPLVDKDVVSKIEEVFERRYNDIDDVIKTSLNIINEVTGLISLSYASAVNNEKFKNINLVPIDDNKAVVIIVSNLGNTPKTTISFKQEQEIDDIQTCIKIFNKYLVDVPFADIEKKLFELEPIIKNEVKEYEYITQELITKMLGITLKKSNVFSQQIVGLKSIFNNPEFNDHEKLKQLVNILDEGNIWDLIKYDMEEKATKDHPIITKQYENLPIAITSTTLIVDQKKYSISVLGPNRIDNQKVFGILEYLHKKINELYK